MKFLVTTSRVFEEIPHVLASLKVLLSGAKKYSLRLVG